MAGRRRPEGGGRSRAPPVLNEHAAHTVGAQEKALPNGGRAGNTKRKGDAAGAESRPPRPAVPPAAPQPAPARGAARETKRLPSLPSHASLRRKRTAGKDGLLRGAESPSPEWGSSLDLPLRWRENKRDKQTFFFDLLVQPGFHHRQHPTCHPTAGPRPP